MIVVIYAMNRDLNMDTMMMGLCISVRGSDEHKIVKATQKYHLDNQKRKKRGIES
jgi:hypothetical protein